MAKKSKSLKNRALKAVEGYRKFMVSKKLLNDKEKLEFTISNLKDTWKNVIQITLEGDIFPNENKYYAVSKVPHGSRGYTLKGFNHEIKRD